MSCSSMTSSSLLAAADGFLLPSAHLCAVLRGTPANAATVWIVPYFSISACINRLVIDSVMVYFLHTSFNSTMAHILTNATINIS